jgi:transcriptional regulator of acetoin/glycerol metabolism
MLRLPALRERADRSALVEALWRRIGGERKLAAETLAALAGYDWPGNARQLVACLRTLAALSESGSSLGVDALPAYLQQRRTTPVAIKAHAHDEALDVQQESAMRAAVETCGGNIARAARKLGISRSTLYRRLGSDPRAH